MIHSGALDTTRAMSSSRSTIETLRAGFPRDPAGLRAFVLDRLRLITQSSAALFYRFGVLDGEPVPVRWMARGVDEIFVSRRAAEGIGWPHADPRVPDRRWEGTFLTMRSVLDPETQLWPSPLYARCHEPAGVHDFLRLVVYDEGRFVGWVGALRRTGEPPFRRAEVRRLAPLARAISDALVMADRAERRSSPEEASDLVLGPDGAVELASLAAERLLAGHDVRGALRAWMGDVDRGREPVMLLGHRVRWSRLIGAGGTRYLLRLEPIPSLEVHPIHVLSQAQREVAALAAAGATAKEIGRMTGISEATVRTHLRQVYLRLDVASRAELAHAFQDAPASLPAAVGA